MTIEQIEAEFGHLTPQQRRFAEIVLRHLANGIIPGPTRLNRDMGFGHRHDPNSIGGRYTKLRRFIFEKEGLVQSGPQWNPRYVFPEGDWRRVARQPR